MRLDDAGVKVHVLVTVDVEAHRGCNPVDDWIYGRHGDEEFGISRIMDICERWGVKATFFLDVAEVWTWGEAAIKQVGVRILERGHDLQLHVHPDHITNGPRFLWEYDYNEQLEIITRSIETFEKLWKKHPLAFRAGKYGANYDTLQALCAAGIKADFSMFYRNRWCGLNDPPLTINNLKCYGDLIEVPVTVFKSFDLLGIKRYDSIALDAVSRYEFKKVFAEMMRKERPEVVVLMLHSFSFIARDSDGNLKGVRTRVIRRVDEFLGFLMRQKKLSFTTAEGLLRVTHNGGRVSLFEENDAVPMIRNRALQYLFTIRRASYLFGRNTRATVFVLFTTGVLIGIAILAWLFGVNR